MRVRARAAMVMTTAALLGSGTAYLDVTDRKIIGERSDACAKAESVLRTVVKGLG
jgi:hypothetical protein